MTETLSFDLANPQEAAQGVLDWAESRLDDLNVRGRTRLQVSLMVEESIMALLSHADAREGAHIRCRSRRLIDTLTLELKVPGERFSFGGNADRLDIDSDGDVQEALQELILHSFGDRLRYRHKGGVNAVRIKAVRSPYGFLYQVLSSIALAVILGACCRLFLPSGAISVLNDNVLTVVRDTFMHALKIVVAPIVFLSVATSVASFGNLSDVGRVGGRFLATSLVLEVLAALLAYAISIGSGALLSPTSFDTASLAQTAVQETHASVSLRDTIVGIVPADFLDPFIQTNMVQLLFLGVVAGLAMDAGGTHLGQLAELMKGLNEFFANMTGIFCRFIPLAVLCMVWSLTITTGAQLLASLAAISGIVVCGLAGLICLDLVRLRLAGMAVRPFLTKFSPAIAHVLSTTSTSVSLPETIRGTVALGVSERVASLTLTLGTIFSKTGSVFYRVLATLLVTHLCGVTVNAAQAASLIVCCLLVCISTPSVPGGAYIAFQIMLASVNAPQEALFCMIAIDAIMDLLVPVANVIATEVTTLAIAKREGELRPS